MAEDSVNFVRRTRQRLSSSDTSGRRRENPSFPVEVGTHNSPSSVHPIATFTPRPWWHEGIEEDGYIHDYLSWHLYAAGREVELGALLLDARWMQLRSQIGTLRAMHIDFTFCYSIPGSCVSQAARNDFEVQSPREHSIVSSSLQTPLLTAGETYKYLYRIVRVSWGRWYEGDRSFQFQLCGRLLDMRSANVLLSTLLESIEFHTPKPYLLPVTSFFPHIDLCPNMEIPLRHCYGCMTNSPCGKYIAVGDGRTAIVLEAEYGKIMARLPCGAQVTCTAFTSDSKKVITGSENGEIIVWDWKAEAPFIRSLGDHGAAVCAVSLASAEDHVIAVTEMGDTRILDFCTGKTVRALDRKGPIKSACISARAGHIATCSVLGSVRVFTFSNSSSFELNWGTSPCYEKEMASVSSVIFSRNGEWLAAIVDERTFLWDTATWKIRGLPFFGKCSSFSENGMFMAMKICHPVEVVQILKLPSGRRVWSSKLVQSAIGSVFTENDKTLVVAGTERLLSLWDVSDMQVRHESVKAVLPRSPNGIAISHDGSIVVSQSLHHSALVWKSSTGRIIKELPSESAARIVGISFASSKGVLMVARDDGNVFLWNLYTDKTTETKVYTETLPTKAVLSADGQRLITCSGSVPGVTNGNNLKETQWGLWRSGEPLLYACESHCGKYLICKEQHGRGSETIIRYRNHSSIESRIAEYSSLYHLPFDMEALIEEYSPLRGRNFYIERIINEYLALKSKTKATEFRQSCELSGRSLNAWSIRWRSGKSTAEEVNLFGSTQIIQRGRYLSDKQAENIIRNCGRHTPFIWPDCFPAFTSELYCARGLIFSDLIPSEEPLASLSYIREEWEYNPRTGVFATPGYAGIPVVCRLVKE